MNRLRRVSTDSYPIATFDPTSKTRRDLPLLARRLDLPNGPPLDRSETARERDNRLALARARFIADERERAERVQHG